MRLTLANSIVFGLIIPLASCLQTNGDKDHTSKKLSSVDSSSTVVLSFDQKGNWPFDSSCKPTYLTTFEIIEVDSLLRQCSLNYNNGLTKNLRSSYDIDFKKYTYIRQYIVVVNSKGEKEVWINAFCNSWDDRWKKEILLVHDGGNCYFNLKINLTTKKCFDVSVNGYA